MPQGAQPQAQQAADQTDPSDRSGRAGQAGQPGQATTADWPVAQVAVDWRRPALLAGRRARTVAEVTDAACAPLDGLDRTSLGFTYWFEAPHEDACGPVSVRLRGRLQERDDDADTGRTSFDLVATVNQVVPGSGWQSITTRVADVASGRWEVTATPLTVGPAAADAAARPRLARGSASGRTGFAMAVDALAPGVWPGSWPALVGLGFLLGIVVQALLAPRLGLSWLPLTGATVVAGILGLLGAKAYFLLTHPAERRRSWRAPGMSVQGFVIVAITVLALATLVTGAPVGAVLDATAPGLFVGMAVGRLGCLFAGCCGGRPTASRWGMWSSDRQIGTRRIPVQLMESALAGVLAVLTAVTVVASPAAGTGLVLGAGFAAYLIGRQLLFPLRAAGRVTTYGRVTTLVVASVALLVALILIWSA
ncbi:prolipoprotein diacylglyceryl transferase family protein [Cellulomonas sp. 73-145]|uniref:prolipoprotein diacylglyceryl transferase n=1 Tax=Cellulomonas sp. 73-145 TaxID=1895739 RepID=UPI0025BC70FB|nr:prolipoprotein diacylglyceryl transferase family protein [Cellulomonas sp. 73-145]